MTISLERLRRCSVAVDLGASRTRVYLKHSGLIVDEPTVAALNTRTGGLLAVGTLAERMAGRTPQHITVVRPVSGGTVVDIAVAQRMLRHLIGNKVRRTWRHKSLQSAAVCVPHDADPLARRAAMETMTGLGARRVELVDSLIAAAVGCGLPVERPEATMILLCGATTTQIAVLSLGSIVASERVQVGGDTVNRAVVEHLRTEHSLALTHQALHPLHLALSATGRPGGATILPTEVHGRDLVTGLARSVEVDPDGVRATVRIPMTGVLDAIGVVLRRCPPDLVSDLADRGMVLAGGSAVLPGLDAMLREAIGIPVQIADHPDVCTVEGLGAMLEGTAEPILLDPLAA